jgi:hypothetical protein
MRGQTGRGPVFAGLRPQKGRGFSGLGWRSAFGAKLKTFRTCGQTYARFASGADEASAPTQAS